jgi:hypothetical protein
VRNRLGRKVNVMIKTQQRTKTQKRTKLKILHRYLNRAGVVRHKDGNRLGLRKRMRIADSVF